ncbi:hypothetical protein BKA70DRAFT_1255667 [Coprinopsis sp. MPI-PUGE-AT-0042]|nr:hypothetical protein BKA70DRAFT_1255667 [Coprinopsis sp. MPI-PUGE-AT-0042]
MGDHHGSPMENKCLEAVEMARGVCSERKESRPCLSSEETFDHSAWSTLAATSLPSLELVVDNPWDDVHGAQIAEELEGSSLATKEEPVAAFPPPNSPQLPSIATEVGGFEQRWRSILFYFICFLLALYGEHPKPDSCGVFSNNLALIRQVLV